MSSPSASGVSSNSSASRNSPPSAGPCAGRRLGLLILLVTVALGAWLFNASIEPDGGDRRLRAQRIRPAPELSTGRLAPQITRAFCIAAVELPARRGLAACLRMDYQMGG